MARSEVRSADEAAFVDAMYGTNLYACAAAGAKIVVDGRKVVLYGDSAVGTGLLALHTADTSVLAVLTYVCALIVVRALNDNTLGIVDKVDDTVGALSYTDTAADTLLGVNSGNAVLNFDSVLRTNNSAVTVAKTSIGAESVAAVRHISGEAGLVALVVVSLFNNVASAVAGNVCNLLYNVGRLNSEDSRNFLSGTVTAGNTEVSLVGNLFCKSLSIAVTSRVAARSTVCTGEAVTDRYSGLILFNTEEDAGNSKKNCAHNADAEENQGRNKYF